MKIDVNCDLGEGMPTDEQVMPYISSCNIACGGHYGNVESIRKTIQLAKENQVKIGAHPSYPDRLNFGRKKVTITNELLVKSLEEQLTLFFNIAKDMNVPVHHIKAHGALYNDLANEEHLCNYYLKLLTRYKSHVLLYVPFNSKIAEMSRKKDFQIAYEVFSDRNYTEDLCLVSRKESNAILSNKETIAEHVLRMIQEKKVKTVNGQIKAIEANTVCIHGDHQDAIITAQYLNKVILKAGFQIG